MPSRHMGDPHACGREQSCLLKWYNRGATIGMGLVSRGLFHFLWLAQGPAELQRERDMTIQALAGAHAGTPEGEDASTSGDLYETTRTFESLGVSEELTKALADQGIVSAFPIQALTVADALAGRDVCGKAKTGSGKTLAFGVPLLQRAKATRDAQGQRPPTRPAQPLALVLLPTRELAVQVHDVVAPLAKRLGLRVVAVYGGADIDRQVAKLRKGVDVIIATPGRLIDLGDRGEIVVDEIETLVLDEADRMADMGFMPQVEWVLRRLKVPHQTLLFSATLDGAIDRLVKRYLHQPRLPRGGILPRPSTRWSTASFRCTRWTRSRWPRPSAGRWRSRCCSCAPSGVPTAWSTSSGRRASRRRHPRRPAPGPPGAGTGRLLLGQAARAGRHRRGRPGPDIDAVDVVIHYDPPEDHKAYLHRSGRTARAGQAGVVVTLALWNQVSTLRSSSAGSACASPSSRCSPTTRACPTSPHGAPPRRASSERQRSRAPAPGPPTTAIRRVLIVTAHPDDVDFGVAGTVAAFTGRAWTSPTALPPTATPAGLTAPSAGPTWPPSASDEQRAAAAEVGVTDVRFLGHPDGRLQPTIELRRDICRVIRQVRPERVLTHRRSVIGTLFASHPDHLAAGEATVCAVYPDARNPFAHPELLDERASSPGR